MLRSEQLLPNLLKRWKLSSVKLISKRIHMRGLSLNRQQSLKVVIVGQNSTNSWKRWTRRKRITACEYMHASAVRAVFGIVLPVLSFVADHAHQYIYESVLWSSTSSLFSSKFKNNSTQCNIT